MHSKKIFLATKWVITPKLQKLPKKIFHTDVDSYLLKGSRTIAPEDNCLLDDCPWITALEENCPPENYPLTIKFPP